MESRNPKKNNGLTIAMLGSLPPLRALSSYCLELSLSMAKLTQVQFVSFKKIYPAFLYPGRSLKDDDTFPRFYHKQLRVKRLLTWYNPLTWFMEGFFTKADLLHAQWWSMPLCLVYACVCLGFKLRRKPVVFTVHNVLPHEKSWVFTFTSGLLFRLGDHFIVHSEKNQNQMATYYGIPRKMISVIPHGPLDFHVSKKWSRETAREELNIKPEDKVILLFGAIRPYKGIDTAISAVARVRKKLPEVRLLIAGKLWEDWAPYERQINRLNLNDCIDKHLRYISSEAVSKFFMAADLVVLPYHHFDSQSGVGAIAVSFRKPMIVTNIGGLPDLVCDPCNVVPPGDEYALGEAIINSCIIPGRLESMEREAMIVAEKIAWPAIAKKTLSIYKSLLNNTSSASNRGVDEE